MVDGQEEPDGASRRPPRPARRRDRHGRGLRGSLVPPGVPLYRTRSERFDDLVLLAVAQLEPRWESELSGIEFGVEEIPPVLPEPGDPEPVPLGRLDHDPGRPARIVVYRRPLLARADGEEELAELVLDVIVEQFARMLGIDPQSIDPGYSADE